MAVLESPIVDNPVLSGEPTPGGACRVCGSKLSENLTCPQCGAAYGEANRCPHCKSVADVEPSDAVRQRCRVCGGPRVPVEDPKVVRSGREIPVLKKARRSHLRGSGWALASGVIAGFGVLSLLVVLLVLAIASPGLIATFAALGAVAVPFLFAFLAWRRAKSARADLKGSLDEAWALVAGDVLAHKGEELTAGELAKLMRIEVAAAEQLLAELSVRDFVHARVTDEGDLAYSVPAPKLRIEDAELDLPADEAEHDQSEVREKAHVERSKT